MYLTDNENCSNVFYIRHYLSLLDRVRCEGTQRRREEEKEEEKEDERKERRGGGNEEGREKKCFINSSSVDLSLGI